MNFRLRCDKISLILKKAEEDMGRGKTADYNYIKNVCESALDGLEEKNCKSAIRELEKISSPDTAERELLFSINNLRYIFLSEIGRDPAEWDLSAYPDKNGSSKRKILDINVYLDNIRSPFNVGSVFRTAESFCFGKVFLSEFTPSPEQNRARRSSMGTSEILEWERRAVDMLPSPVFALELGGTPLESFDFPEKGTVIIGSEELGVSPEAMRRSADEGGVVLYLYMVSNHLSTSV